ncbi:hypothetical protein FNV62_54040 [Streptomyces sp. RLB3-17]|uniref:hypothetical protein n=1 Tax=unclassified Streptomyces TaxID=2593676 RepID=UPI00116200BC|nr:MULTISPECIES: hypothetical protein [unclassified Streptomyces]NMI54343.1 hypothetical protein [Streptomyces sp. RLA2-12]QDN63072.1 hypothetical protein FNV67_55155 [Streptomyces sp. S1D4-20]QDN73124.1 hypothetical protein FNV66_54035 [Streptomyces sp. S1D4-14]QDO03833.1 hypothetical protein FNV58_55635 [Streptomyces sp. RLB1-9]QDO25564.1 hypothetical protein FNV65_54220 [Streptomyces sp. S1A1-8]
MPPSPSSAWPGTRAVWWRPTRPVQLAALGRLGDLPVFWAALPEPLRTLFNTRVEGIGQAERSGALQTDDARVVALVADAEVRASLPALEGAFTELPATDRCRVIAVRPAPYFTAHLPALLEEVGSFDQGQFEPAPACSRVPACCPFRTCGRS